MKRRQLQTLRKSAQSTTSARNHRMVWGPIRRKSHDPLIEGQIQDGDCKDCGDWVRLETHPAPNSIDIGGIALAQDCDKRKVR